MNDMYKGPYWVGMEIEVQQDIYIASSDAKYLYEGGMLTKEDIEEAIYLIHKRGSVLTCTSTDENSLGKVINAYFRGGDEEYEGLDLEERFFEVINEPKYILQEYGQWGYHELAVEYGLLAETMEQLIGMPVVIVARTVVGNNFEEHFYDINVGGLRLQGVSGLFIKGIENYGEYELTYFEQECSVERPVASHQIFDSWPDMIRFMCEVYAPPSIKTIAQQNILLGDFTRAVDNEVGTAKISWRERNVLTIAAPHNEMEQHIFIYRKLRN